MRSKKLALSGILAGLAICLMLLGSIIPFSTFATPAIAGAVIIPVAIEFGLSTGWLLYGAISLLSILMVADKEMALMFVFLMGFYPLLKAVFERGIRPKFICILVKLALFNICIFAMYSVMLFLFPINYIVEEFASYGIGYIVALLALGNLVFMVYDVALSRLIDVYMIKWRPKLFK